MAAAAEYLLGIQRWLCLFLLKMPQVIESVKNVKPIKIHRQISILYEQNRTSDEKIKRLRWIAIYPYRKLYAES